MSISVLNTDAGLSGKTIINLEDAQTVTGLKTYDRDPNPPFAVTANSAVVPNLIAESLSGGTVTATSATFSGAVTMATTLGVTGIITGRDVTAITSTGTGAVNNWDPGIVNGTTYIQWSGAGDLIPTGFGSGTTGKVIVFRNTGSNVAYFAHNSGSSTVPCFNSTTSGATPVAPGGYAIWVCNGAVWVLVAHDQGAWITPTFNAGDYTASAGTWTVDAGDVTACKYRLVGRTHHTNLFIATTDVSNAGVTLSRVIPGGYTAAQSSQQLTRSNDAGAGFVTGLAVFAISSTAITFSSTVAGAGYAITAADNTYVIATLTTEVT